MKVFILVALFVSAVACASLTDYTKSGSPVAGCPQPPFFTVESGYIYFCVTDFTGSLDVNVHFSNNNDNYNFHPNLNATANSCYKVFIPTQYGDASWCQVNGFDCHYGNPNTGNGQNNCGWGLCPNPTTTTTTTLAPTTKAPTTTKAPKATTTKAPATTKAAATTTSAPSTCPPAPFFTVSDTSVYFCYTTFVDYLDINVQFSDGYFFNWHPNTKNTPNECYNVPIPAGHGHPNYTQVNGFDCHYGMDNSGRVINCGYNLCQQPTTTPAPISTCPPAPFYTVSDTSVYFCYTDFVDYLDINVQFSDGYFFNWHPNTKNVVGGCYDVPIPAGHGHPNYTQVNGFDCHYGMDNSGRVINCGYNFCNPNATTSTTAAPTTTTTTTLAPTAAPTTSAPATKVTTMAPTTMAPTTRAPTTAAPTTTTAAPTTCPPAPFFSVTDDRVDFCYTSFVDYLDVNVQFSDGYFFNWHPNTMNKANACYTVPLPPGHGKPNYTQVNGFDCHYGMDNSGRVINCGYNLCPVATTPAPVTQAPKCVPPPAPYFTVNETSVYFCYTTFSDSLDVNVRFGDNYNYNFHPNHNATANTCYEVDFPSGHGNPVWVQVNGFDCHYGENNSGRAQNCGWNLCQNMTTMSTTSAPSNSNSTNVVSFALPTVTVPLASILFVAIAALFL